AAADGQYPAEQFDYEHAEPNEIPKAMENGFKMRDAASTRFRRVAIHQRNSQRGARSTERHRKYPAEHRDHVSPAYEHIPQCIGSRQQTAKRHGDNSRAYADQSRARK